jgi:hypothetical protein
MYILFSLFVLYRRTGSRLDGDLHWAEFQCLEPRVSLGELLLVDFIRTDALGGSTMGGRGKNWSQQLSGLCRCNLLGGRCRGREWMFMRGGMHC